MAQVLVMAVKEIIKLWDVFKRGQPEYNEELWVAFEGWCKEGKQSGNFKFQVHILQYNLKKVL